MPTERFSTTFTPGDDGLLVAMRSRIVVRFLMSDGTTVDVETERDDSDLRGALVQHLGCGIAGSTVVRDG